MISNFDLTKIPQLVKKQLSNFFPLSPEEEEIIEKTFQPVLDRLETCFTSVDNKYFHREEKVFFSPFHSGQWLIFLYYLANFISTKLALTQINKSLRGGGEALADKIYYLNKILHCVDIYHQVELPSTFFLEHPVGTVLGRAKYQDGFMAYQNCTVGASKEGIYPTLGKNFRMMSGSKILGKSNVGDNVTLAANTYVKDTDIPDNSLVFGNSPNLIIKFRH